MKRNFLHSIIGLILLATTFAGGQVIDRKAVFDSLTTLDPEIVQYFPRWKVCEYDLQIQIYQSFIIMGYDKSELDMQNIEILASPRDYEYKPFEILSIKCGKSSLNSVEIESNMGGSLIGYLSGEQYYSGPRKGDVRDDDAKREYCFSDIPPETPLPPAFVDAITDYLRPTNVNHAITISLFEQSLKFGETGFWLRSKIGNDQVGYPFWSAGESKLILQRPLYPNADNASRDRLPYLIDAYVGGGYRITSGINDNSSLLSWVKDRILNTGKGGKLIAGLDFHVPFYPEFGVSFNAEIPLQGLQGNMDIDDPAYGYVYRDDVELAEWHPGFGRFRVEKVAPMLRATGQIAAFYHWWLNEDHPENYFRFDVGLNYFEVKELAAYRNTDLNTTFLTLDATNLETYKPKEFGDWLFLKVEYRNQAAFPFGLSAQYSNQMLLGRVYIPIFGNWFYLEGKYATPLRGVRSYEAQNFFMISPVIRLTI